MIQQQTKLCLGTMKMVPWPTLIRGVSKALRPPFMNGQVAILPYSCTSTLAQAKTQSPPPKEPIQTKDSSGAAVTEASSPLKSSKEVAVIMKVKEVAAALELCATFNSQQRFEVSSSSPPNHLFLFNPKNNCLFFLISLGFEELCCNKNPAFTFNSEYY